MSAYACIQYYQERHPPAPSDGGDFVQDVADILVGTLSVLFVVAIIADLFRRPRYVILEAIEIPVVVVERVA